jgi:hypothetical protein
MRTAALSVLLLIAPAFGADATGILSPRPDSESVTIYRDLFALVPETRTVDLPEGAVTLSFDGVVETLLPASVVLAETGRQLEERNYDYDELTPNRLFQKSIGEKVILTRTLPGSGQVKQVEAVVIAAGTGGITFRTAEGNEALHCSGVPEHVTFARIPDELHTRPRLSVRLAAGPAGKRTVKLSYLAHGFVWKSDYVARINERGDRMNLQGWVTLRNLTNANLRDAQVQVVAGKLNLIDEDDGGTSLFGDTDGIDDQNGLRNGREEALADFEDELAGESDPELRLFSGCFPVQDLRFRYSVAAAAPVGAMYDKFASEELQEVVVTGLRASQALAEGLGDYHLYRIPWTTDLSARQTKQVVFLRKPAVKVDAFYSATVDADDSEEEVTLIVPRLVLGLVNRKSFGLGEALPEGIFRLYEPGDGREVFLGEGWIDDVSVGAPEEIVVAGAIDLSLDLKIEDRGETQGDGEAVVNEANAAIRIANAKGVPVTVEIRQQTGYFMGQMSIPTASRRPFRKHGDFAWRIRVPPNADGTLTYRLRLEEIAENETD